MIQQDFLPRDVEYQALRRFLKQVERAETGTLTENMASALVVQLTPTPQQMVHKYYFDKNLIHEIADNLQVNVSTVSRTIGRGRRRLRRCLRYGGRALMETLDL